MENPTHSFRETNLVLQLMEESRIKCKTVMRWSSRKKKRGHFCTAYFVRRKFCYHFCFTSIMVYWINFQNIYTFTYQETELWTLFYLLLTFSKAFGVSLIRQLSSNPWYTDELWYFLYLKSFSHWKMLLLSKMTSQERNLKSLRKISDASIIEKIYKYRTRL